MAKQVKLTEAQIAERERLSREYKAAVIRHERLWREACPDIPVGAEIVHNQRAELSYIMVGDFQVMRLPDSEEFGVMPATLRKMSIIEAAAYRDALTIAIKVAQQVNAAMQAMAKFEEGA